MNADDHLKTWQSSSERIASIRSNIERGHYRAVLERSASQVGTARPLRKLGIKKV